MKQFLYILVSPPVSLYTFPILSHRSPPQNLESRNIPSKDPCNHPVHRNHNLVSYTHALGEIRRPPQDPRCTTLDLIRVALVNRSPAPQVRHRTKVAELESWPIDARIPRVDPFAQVDGLLTGYLGGGRERLSRHHRAVADGKYVRESLCRSRCQRAAVVAVAATIHRLDLNPHVIIRNDAARLWVPGNLSHPLYSLIQEPANQRILHQASAPHHDTCSDLFRLLLDAEHEVVTLTADPLQVMLRLDGDALSLEYACGVLGEAGIKHGQHLGGNVVDGNGHKRHQFGIQFGHVLVDEIMQLGRKLDTRWTTTDNGKMKQLPPLLVARRRQLRLAKSIQDLNADGARIGYIPQEVGMLPHALDAKRLAIAAHGNYQLIVLDLELVTLDEVQVHPRGRIITLVRLHQDPLARKVNVRRPGLVEPVQAQPPDWLRSRTELEGPNGRGCQ